MLASRFKVLLADAGLSIDEAAKLLHVTPRTVRYWISGKVGIPYAAYKLVRVLRWFELPGDAWAGWHMHSGKLWSPEGHGFNPHDSNWWGLLVRQARSFQTLYERESAFRQALSAGRTDHPAGAGTAAGVMRSRGELAGPTGNAGGAAQPPRLDLSNKHFGTYGADIGLAAGSVADQVVTGGRS